MPNAWLNHVRQFRKQNRHLSYKQLLKQAKNTYGGVEEEKQSRRGGMHGGIDGVDAAMKLLGQKKGGSVTGMESRSSLTRMATRVGGRSRKTRRRRR
jgi:hypothetical protein